MGWSPDLFVVHIAISISCTCLPRFTRRIQLFGSFDQCSRLVALTTLISESTTGKQELFDMHASEKAHAEFD
jgi:hypothetical protein